jgi:hypothetical protein
MAQELINHSTKLCALIAAFSASPYPRNARNDDEPQLPLAMIIIISRVTALWL